MKKWCFLLVVLLTLVVGCGGGGSGGGSSAIGNITGHWEGSGTWTILTPAEQSVPVIFTADFVQTGTAVTGIFSMENGSLTTGVFSSTTRSGDVIGGIMDNGGHAFDTAVFTATVGANTINGQASGSYIASDFELSFNVTLVP